MTNIFYNANKHCFYGTDCFNCDYFEVPDFNAHFLEFKTILLRYINAHLDFASFGQEHSGLIIGWYANNSRVTVTYSYSQLEPFIEKPWEFVKKYIEPEVTKIYGEEW